MFIPKFSYSSKLISNIGEIREIVGGLNVRRFPHTVLYKMGDDAKALSAYSSTSIEGNPLPLTDVRQILKTRPRNIRDSQREVLNYNAALIYLDTVIKSKRKASFDHKFINKIHSLVMRDLPYASTKYRNFPVFVNDPIRRETVYWSPDQQDVKGLMDDLVNYVESNSIGLEPLILAGIFHMRFVIIHPFVDGNGRTTRLLTKLLLARMGLDTFQLFSFENYYNSNISKYFEKVGLKGNYYDVYGEHDFTDWLEYFTDGVLDELKRVEKILPSYSSPSDMLEDHHYLILDLIQGSGVVTDSEYAKVSKRSRASRTLDFQKLIQLGYIEKRGAARATYYVLSSDSNGD